MKSNDFCIYFSFFFHGIYKILIKIKKKVKYNENDYIICTIPFGDHLKIFGMTVCKIPNGIIVRFSFVFECAVYFFSKPNKTKDDANPRVLK